MGLRSGVVAAAVAAAVAGTACSWARVHSTPRGDPPRCSTRKPLYVDGGFAIGYATLGVTLAVVGDDFDGEEAVLPIAGIALIVAASIHAASFGSGAARHHDCTRLRPPPGADR